MDEVCTAIREKLTNIGTVGKYIIVEQDDLTEGLPPEKQNAESVTEALKKLRTEGWIDLRYARGELYCLALLKKWERPVEAKPQPVLQESTALPIWQQGLIFAVCSTLGAFLGGLLSGLF